MICKKCGHNVGKYDVIFVEGHPVMIGKNVIWHRPCRIYCPCGAELKY